MSPKVWEASGHTANFTNVLIDCKSCKYRTRADHLIEDNVSSIGNVEGKSLEELDEIISKNKIACPNCGEHNWTKSRKFNQLFETTVGIITTGQNTAYLRGELAQGMFVNFKNTVDAFHPKLPFGMAQIGKAFRNEIAPRDFLFRQREFEQMEIEYFIREEDWEKYFEYWRGEILSFMEEIGVDMSKVHEVEVGDADRAHYSKRTIDFEFEYPFGQRELLGLAYSHFNTPVNKQERVDARALKIIKKRGGLV